MLRIFLPLYLALTLFFIGFIVAIQFIPEFLLSSKMEDYDHRVSRGTFYLLEQKLQDLSSDEQQTMVLELQTQFGFPIKLLDKHNDSLDDDDWQDLDSGKILAIDIDDAEYYVKKSKYVDGVLAFTFEESQSEIDHREAKGTFYLIHDRLKLHPQDEWQGVIAELQSHFGFPLKLQFLDEIKSSTEKIDLLKEGNIIALDHESDNYRFIGRLFDSPYVLIAGPIIAPISELGFLSAILLSLILFLAIALFFWVRPLWSSVRELSQTADAFGQGNLKARTSIKRSATLGQLAWQFNAMADRIGGLITGHRELTNAVSHELRTPLARMRFGLDMLQDTADDDARDRYLQGIHTDIEDLEGLIGELLNYARFERNELHEKKEKVAIVPWLEEVVENARGYAGETKLSCAVDSLSREQLISFHPAYMSRVIHNLIRNACRYGKGNICVSIELTDLNTVIHVDDNGPGIPESDRKRVFDVFARLDESRDKKSGGYGLGLAIAQRIVESHHGEILISDSTLGGTRFSIFWPKDG